MPTTITPKKILKADIFFKRVNGKPRSSDRRLETPVDALYSSLSDRARVDIPYMRSLFPGLSEAEIVTALKTATVKVKNGKEWVTETRALIFFDPEQQAWVTRDEYLSGDTRKKLELLQFFKEETPETYNSLGLQDNEEALAQCLPKYLLPPPAIDPDVRGEVAHRMGGDKECDLEGVAYIDLRLGCPILTPGDIQDFIAYLINWRDPSQIIVDHVPMLGTWAIEAGTYELREPSEKSEYALSYECETYDGCFHVSRDLFWVVTQALNGTVPRLEIRDAEDHILPEPTRLCSQAALTAIDKVKRLFKDWVWTDVERACRLTAEYNRVFPRRIRRRYDGSHLCLPGSNPKIQLNPWQLDGVWRIILSATTLLSWEVGSGKSFTMIAAAMEMKRLGLARKPMLLCLNGTEGQLAADFLKLYPKAKLLIADEKSFKKENRRKLISQIRSSDWDCVILAHSQFFTIPVTHDTKQEYIQDELRKLSVYQDEVDGDYLLKRVVEEQISNLEGKIEKNEAVDKAIQAALKGDEATIVNLINEGLIELTPGGRFKSASQKVKDKAAKKVNRTVAQAMDNYRKDPVVFWEALGVDWVALDEAHVVKNLQRATKLRYIAGLSNPNTQRSLDALLKFHHTLSKGGRVVFSTGTPCSNSMAEWWVVQRFLGNDRLKSTLDMDHFDNWAHQFGEITTDIEITHTGGMKPRTRFGRFCNLFILMDMIAEFTDFVRADNVGLDRPKPNYLTVTADAGSDQIAFLDEILERNEALSRRKPWRYVNKDGKTVEDNALTLTNLGSLNALDPRLVNPQARNFRNSKLNLAVHNIWWIWKVTTPAKLTQLVFSDLGVPGDDETLFNAYWYIRDALIALGIPAEQIAIIHDYKRSQLQKLYQKIRAGEIRILIGSTDKCGTGVNVQDLCIAGHDISIPWTPAKLDQRRGRVHRQGNLNSEILLFTYVTKGRNGQPGFDAFKVQTVELKHNFISQFLSGEVTRNDYEESDDEAMSYNLTKALASGDPRIMEFAKVGDRIKQLEVEVNALATKMARDVSTVRHLPRRIEILEARLKAVRKDVATRDKYMNLLTGDMVNYKAGSKVYAAIQEAGSKIVSQIKRIEKEGVIASDVKLGEFAGFTLRMPYYNGSRYGVQNLELMGTPYPHPDYDDPRCNGYRFESRYTPETMIALMRDALLKGYHSPGELLDRLTADYNNALREQESIPARLGTMKQEFTKLQSELSTLQDREAQLKSELAIVQAKKPADEDEEEEETVDQPKPQATQTREGRFVEGSKPAKYRPPEPSVVEYLKSLSEPCSEDVDGNIVTWIPKVRELTKEFLSRLREREQNKVIDLPVTRPAMTLAAIAGGINQKSKRKTSEGQLTLFEMFA